MTEEAKKPELRALVIDARALDGVLVDAAPGATKGMRRAQPGFDLVLKEIVDNQASAGSRIGVLPSQVDELKRLTQEMSKIDDYLPAVEKLAEMMRETKTILDHRRQEIVSVIAKIVDAQAPVMKNDAFLAHYEKTREYRSAIAKKAVKTRKKKTAESSARAEAAE